MDRSLHGWAEMFDKIEMENRKGTFDTDVRADFRRIEEFRLPTYCRLLVAPRVFLENFSVYEKQFVFPAYYAQVYPQANGLNKYNLMNFHSLSDVKPFVEDKISKYLDRYLLLVSEFEENVYGGSIMSDGVSVNIDIAKGLQNQISYGNKAYSSCRVTQGDEVSYSGVLNDSGTSIVPLFDEVLDSISVLSNSVDSRFLKGYFEFAFTKPLQKDGLRLVFFDYKTDRKFYDVR